MNTSARPAGYSGTPLPKKLGLRDGQHVAFVDLPESLGWLAEAASFAALRRIGWDEAGALGPGHDLVHAFAVERRLLERHAADLRNAVAPGGMVRVSWPKRASGVVTDLTEDVIRTIVLPIGLVDVKVCAVDGIWSGLKLVIRKALR